MGCMGNCLVLLVNLAVLLVALGIVGLSSYIVHLSMTYQHMMDEGGAVLLYVPLATLIGGAILTLICFFGCCGILRRSPCMLRTYGSLVLVFFSIELTCGVLFIVRKDDLLKLVRMGMKQNIAKYGEKYKSLSDGIDITEHDLKCCGVDGYQDWSTIIPGGLSVTKGCCRSGPGIDADTCYKDILLQPPRKINETIYMKGCFPALQSLVSHEAMALGIMAISLSVLQLILMIISFTQAANYSRHKENYGYNYDSMMYR